MCNERTAITNMTRASTENACASWKPKKAPECRRGIYTNIEKEIVASPTSESIASRSELKHTWPRAAHADAHLQRPPRRFHRALHQHAGSWQPRRQRQSIRSLLGASRAGNKSIQCNGGRGDVTTAPSTSSTSFAPGSINPLAHRLASKGVGRRFIQPRALSARHASRHARLAAAADTGKQALVLTMRRCDTRGVRNQFTRA